MTFTEPQFLAIEAGFRALAQGIGRRTTVGLLYELAELLDRIDQQATTNDDDALLASLPSTALAQHNHQPTEFVRFVHLVYWKD